MLDPERGVAVGESPRPISSLDIGCPACGATFTVHETHDCPGYDLWAQRDCYCPVRRGDGTHEELCLRRQYGDR